MKRILALLLALLLALSLAVTGYASSGETAAAEDDGLDAYLSFGDDGEEPDREQTKGFEMSLFDGGGRTDEGIGGFLFTSDDVGVNFLYSETAVDTGAFYTVGGPGENLRLADAGVDFTPAAAAFLEELGVTAFDSAIVLGDGGSADSAEPVISAKGWTRLELDGVLLYAEGTARSAVYSDVVGGSTVPGAGGGGSSNISEEPVVVFRNSLIETTGGTAEAVEGAISVGNTGGRARGIQPQGKSVTYLYNSAVVSRTWGAFSTDSARSTLELVAYNSLGYSTSGYGAYADTSCHLFLYGSQVTGASDGVVASNDGEIYAVSSGCELSGTELRALMGKTAARDVSAADYLEEPGDARDSCLSGGSTAVQFHMPDLGKSGARSTRKGTLYMQGGSLVTDEALVGELSAYNARYAGACLVTKSTQANVLLEGTAMESWSGELIHTMINSDSNVNNIADGDTAPGSDVTFRDMDVAGDVVCDDYQRALRLTLDGTTLTGAIRSTTCEEWNAFCEAQCDGEYILNPDGYEAVWGCELTLTNGAVWNVTEPSRLTGLTVEDGCAVNGTVTENADGSFTVEPLAGQGFSDSFDLSLTINGQPVVAASVPGEIDDGSVRFDLGSLLAAIGVALQYDEASGAVRFSQN